MGFYSLKYLRILLLVLCVTGAISLSCQKKDECKYCRVVIYKADTLYDDTDTPQEYCDVELEKIEAKGKETFLPGSYSMYVCE